MSATTRFVGELREAGVVDAMGERQMPNYGAGDRQPVQGASGTRVNPGDVLGNERFLERRSVMEDNRPVAFWFKGVTRWSHPGYAYCYEEVAENNGEYRENKMKDGRNAQRWLTNHGYRIVYRSPVKGERCDITECWGHVRYFGEPDNPDRFIAKSTAELREYIALAVASNNEPETVAPELPVEEATVQPDHVESIVDKIANWVGVYFTAKEAGWLA